MITETVKEAIINKALNRGKQTLAEVALANNIPLGTLGRWLTKSRSLVKSGGKAVNGLIGLGDRYKHLKATFGQEDVNVGAYCRKHGIYTHQLTEWETEFMTNNNPLCNKNNNIDVKILQKEVKELKKTIQRKDKVLAETMALLILKKKAIHIWGDSEDD